MQDWVAQIGQVVMGDTHLRGEHDGFAKAFMEQYYYAVWTQKGEFLLQIPLIQKPQHTTAPTRLSTDASSIRFDVTAKWEHLAYEFEEGYCVLTTSWGTKKTNSFIRIVIFLPNSPIKLNIMHAHF